MARTLNVKLDSEDIVDIEVSNVNDKVVCVISVDASDNEVPIRFAEMLNNLDTISADVEQKEKELKEKYKDIPADEFNYDKTIETSRFHIDSLHRIADEIDNLFGTGTIDAVFSEHIELNPDYVPDEYAIMDFIDKIIPAMNQIYNKRFEENRKKYNVTRRGAKRHNLTKEELIQRQMGK